MTLILSIIDARDIAQNQENACSRLYGRAIRTGRSIDFVHQRNKGVFPFSADQLFLQGYFPCQNDIVHVTATRRTSPVGSAPCFASATGW